jgi:DUF1680 family protein
MMTSFGRKRDPCQRKLGADIRRYGFPSSFSILVMACLWAQPSGALCAEEPVAVAHVLTAVPGPRVVIDDGFWAPKLKVWREVTIPDCFAKFERDGALENFDKVRDGTRGSHGGPPWYDGLIYEMTRASADFLACHSDPALEARLDAYIERIAAAAAKNADGYVNTYTQLVEPTHRWGLGGGNDREQHDVYNAGALVEAAVHYYRATGKERLLRVAVKLANHMADVMGPPPKKNVVPGHALSEEALVELYRLFRQEPDLKARMPVPVNEGRYLKLAQFWVENRGHHEGRQSFGAYDQDDKPVLEQRSIEGHAVRATLLWAGVVAIGIENGRGDYLAAARQIWENLVGRRMYVTGGVGAVAAIEGFGRDYELPNNGYLETCAAVGAGFFHQNLAMAFADGRYADELERVLYNGALSGVSLKGDRYFYDNPLVAAAGRARWSWHACPCCPPMFLKMMGALPGYIYATGSDGVYINQFVGSRTTITSKSTKIDLRQTTRYPWDGEIVLQVDPERPVELALYVRLPSWCAEPRISVNSEARPAFERVRGYACLRRIWKPGDSVRLSLPMPVERVEPGPNVRANTRRAAIRRGPVIYCFESEDNTGHVGDLVIPVGTQFTSEYRPDWLGGVTIVRGKATVLEPRHAGATVRRARDIDVTAIPYFANANRQPGAMMVWMAGSPDRARGHNLASRAQASASHCNPSDTLSALSGQVEEPAASDDSTIRRFTWWDHRGCKEWVQYDFARAEKVSAVEVYWWDERRLKAHCRVPASWRLLYRTGEGWAPVTGAGTYGTEIDRFNQVTFSPVVTESLRLEVQLQPGWSGGILEWRVE